MFAVDVYATVRRVVHLEGDGQRETARVFGLSREGVCKTCRFSIWPRYTPTKPVAKAKLGTLSSVIDANLEADRTASDKPRHTAKRIFERLRDGQGYGDGMTVVVNDVQIFRDRQQEISAGGPGGRQRYSWLATR